MTMNKIFTKLRRKNEGQYRLLSFCIFLSVFLVSSFSFMYFGPTVQEFLPQGGDTRKMAVLLLAVTAAGCTIFTVYASTLFFRHKSREFGIFLALGEQKKALSSVLFSELAKLTAQASFLGIILGIPASFLIWKLFESFLISTGEMSYRFGISGIFAGTGFAVILAFVLGIMGRRFVSKTNIIDILKAGQKTESVKEISPLALPIGIILTVTGILAGLGANPLAVRLLKHSIPGTNLFYLLALIGVYLILLSAVSQTRLKRNREKFYKNMVSVSLMRFSAKSTTRNMCVIVLLLFSCVFSAFFGMLYMDTQGISNLENSNAFSIHYPVQEQQITKKDIYSIAKKHQMQITDYAESDTANLVISYKNVDSVDDEYITQNNDQAKLALFFSEKTYERLTGRSVQVSPGTYQTIVPTDYKENIWEFQDGLYEITNPDTKKSLPLTYAGSQEYDALHTMSSPYSYILNNKDYQKMSKGLSSQYTEHIVLFDVKDYETSYSFGKDLLKQYTEHATGLSNHYGNYDLWEDMLHQANGEDYSYAGQIDLSPDNTQLIDDWKYAPSFVIVTTQDFLQLISVYAMLCLYIFIITLSAVAVMCCVRSVSIVEDNRTLFNNLTKLGANETYRRHILKKQLSKIFQYPGILGCTLGILFSASMCWINDGRYTAGETTTLIVVTGLCAFIGVFLYVLYRVNLGRSKV